MDQLRPPMTGKALGRGARWVGASALAVLAASVALFASLNAERTRPPLQHTLASAEAAAQEAVRAMQAGDVHRLRRLALSEQEFRALIWPELPASRPERNVPFEFVWDRLQQNSLAHLRGSMLGIGGQPLRVRAVRFLGATTAYGDVTVHRDSVLEVAGPDGVTRTVRLLGSMAEQDGRWKVFSYVVD